MALAARQFDDTLRLLAETSPSNRDFLDDLRDRCIGPQPVPLLPFIGAGLSMPMGFPSWKGFLSRLAAESGKSSEVAELLTDGKYEEAAEAVEFGLSPTLFNRHIEQTFGERKSQSATLTGSVLALPQIAGGAVVTTNFDRILERVFAEASAPFEHVVWGSQVDSIRRAVADNKPLLVKIHGDSEERTNRVLTKSEYDKQYAPGDPTGLRAQLARIFQGRTLLFLGCSLGVDRTMDVLADVLRHAAGSEHYALVPKPASDAEFFARQKLLGERGILPIWYPEGRHDVIEHFLRWLATLQPSARIAAPELVLESPSQRAPKVRSELDLLVPNQRTTAFVGRDAELASLRGWLASDAPVSVRVLTGSGGTGKTRLAIELLEWLDDTDTEPGQWNAGFLTVAEIARFSGLQNISQWKRAKAVLAVVDYAAGAAALLRPWLEPLANAANGGEKLRLLLVERDASFDVGWLASMIPLGYSAGAVVSLFDPPAPVRLEPVDVASDRRSVLRATLEAGAKLRGVQPPVVPARGQDAAFDRRIEEPVWGDPLALMMAALNALDSGTVSALSLARADLALYLADHERDRLRRSAPSAPPELMEHMAAYVTVSGGLSRSELQQASKAESDAIGRAHPEGWAGLADAVGDALAGAPGAKPVEPDVVGEAFLLRVWGGSRSAQGADTIVRAAKARGRQVAAAVMRSVQDFGVGEQPHQEPVVWLDALIGGGTDVELLWQLTAALPARTLALRERAVQVEALLAEALRDATGEEALAQRAGVMNNLGLRLGDLGRRDEALAATAKAVSITSQLANANSDEYGPAFGTALSNLSIRYRDVGRLEDAGDAAGDAVRVFQALAAGHPGAFEPDLGRALNNHGTILSNLGNFEQALGTMGAAVAIYRGLAEQSSQKFLPSLAQSLSNLGNILSNVKHLHEALEMTQESVRIRRDLAIERPDSFFPDVAESLVNLGNRFSDLEHYDEALTAANEAVKIYDQLTARFPEAFVPKMATALAARGTILQRADRVAEAAADFRLAVLYLKPLFLSSPVSFEPLMRALVIGYRDRSEEAKLEVDWDAVREVVPLLDRG